MIGPPRLAGTNEKADFLSLSLDFSLMAFNSMSFDIVPQRWHEVIRVRYEGLDRRLFRRLD